MPQERRGCELTGSRLRGPTPHDEHPVGFGRREQLRIPNGVRGRQRLLYEHTSTTSLGLADRTFVMSCSLMPSSQGAGRASRKVHERTTRGSSFADLVQDLRSSM
jgi:hypothetical protein